LDNVSDSQVDMFIFCDRDPRQRNLSYPAIMLTA